MIIVKMIPDNIILFGHSVLNDLSVVLQET